MAAMRKSKEENDWEEGASALQLQQREETMSYRQGKGRGKGLAVRLDQWMAALSETDGEEGEEEHRDAGQLGLG